MNVKEIKDLLQVISKLDLKEVKIKHKDFVLKVRTDKDNLPPIVSAGHQSIAPSQDAVPIASTTLGSSASTQESEGGNLDDNASESKASGNYIEIKSPMVGTFYRSPSPDKPPYVQVGDMLSVGSVVCVIEAMKLFNEIESEISGKIVKVIAEDSSPVEYDQVLFLVDPGA